MPGLVGFLFIYILGGITFLPLLILSILVHAHLTFPRSLKETPTREDTVVRPGDDIDAIKRAQKGLGEKIKVKEKDGGDVAAGYFAVCREYIPGGAGGKPPERTTPVGSTTVQPQSPSVYQSMYRSIFDRKGNTAGPLDNKAGRPQKRGGNVFYVVLRHGHLILFDDDEQLEVRHVVSLAHHSVSICSGGDETPEGELFIKRNAVCLTRKPDAGELTPDGIASKPFYLFSENCSEKEDFYFALLRNQEQTPDLKTTPPKPLQFEVKDIIGLVQRLHSSEEHLQTRWLNAIIGRLFLALYKTAEVENFVRAKITKKISRVKTPSFLSKIVLQNINLGEAAPVITNPRLKELTVDGELVVEADFRYSGNARIEVAATARIELGSRFKAREVNLLLAVVLKRLEGHMMLRIKPPPSNRFWVTFETMPKVDMTIEPIVSSRQITYTLILRQIENRIKEVIAESLVFPNWDDSPFYNSEANLWRGGIWADDRLAAPRSFQDAESVAAEHGDVDEVENLENEEAIMALPQMEKGTTTPTSVDTAPHGGAQQRKGVRSAISLVNINSSGSSSSIDTQSGIPDRPRAGRSGSLISMSSPSFDTDTTNADASFPSTPPEKSHAAAAMAAISANSPVLTPTGGSPMQPSPMQPTRMEKSSSQSSHESLHSEAGSQNESTPQPSINSNASRNSLAHDGAARPVSPSSASTKSEAPSTAPSNKSFSTFPWDRNSRREDSSSSSVKSNETTNKRLSIAAINNAAATAKKWGWNALQRSNDTKLDGTAEEPARPIVMGRGQPLPPPGVPLPPPDKKSKTGPITVPKRKPMPPPAIPEKHKETSTNPLSPQRHAAPPPPLPKRRSRDEGKDDSIAGDGLLVVSAPMGDSEPTTPVNESPPSYMQPWAEDAEELGEEPNVAAVPHSSPGQVSSPPRLPKRRNSHRVLSSSPEEDGRRLPSWMAAQEEEARGKSTLVDEDSVYER